MTDVSEQRFLRQTVRIDLTCDDLMPAVVPRVVSMLAAQTQLGVDRVTQLLEVASDLSNFLCTEMAGESLTFSIDVSSDELVLDVGPLTERTEQAVRELVGAANSPHLHAHILPGSDNPGRCARISVAR